MKKKKIVSLVMAVIICVGFCFNSFCGWLYLPDMKEWMYWIDKENTFAVNRWLCIDYDNDGKGEYYYFNEIGIMQKNTTNKEGYQFDDKGRWIKDGVIQTKVLNNGLNTLDAQNLALQAQLQAQMTAIAQQQALLAQNQALAGSLNTNNTTNTNNNTALGYEIVGKDTSVGPLASSTNGGSIIQPSQTSQITGNTTNANNTTIVTSNNTTSTSEKKKELKENIKGKSGVEFLDTKRINGSAWNNVIRMSGNDSYIKADSGPYNKLSFECGVVSPSENANYELSVSINGQDYQKFGIEAFNTNDLIILEFDPNVEVMLVYNCTADEGTYLSSDNKYLYIRKANFSTKKE